MFMALALWLILAVLILPLFYRYIPYAWPQHEFAMPGQTRHYYLFTPELPDNKQLRPLYIFLMGIDHEENPSQDTRHNYEKVAEIARERQIIAAFPRGRVGAFSEIPDMRAWYPDYFRENQEFIASLTRHLQSTLPVDPNHIVLMGFSNGGYFAGIDVLTSSDSPYTGFWLDGGAYPYAYSQAVPPRPIFLSYGENDSYNRPHVEKYREFILARAWQEGRNLRTFMHKKGHGFSDQALKEGMDFFAAFFSKQE